MPKYLLVPGPVFDAKVGDFVYLGSQMLSLLYKVPMSDCVIKAHGLTCHDESYKGLVWLTPDPTGKYHAGC
uniref:Uncharacterized protein n=1 Tax=viral metagenome TaxID=1070528 RepID=A0A6M3LYI3_9ZZZZ